MRRLSHPGVPKDLIVGTDGVDTLDASAAGSRVYGAGGGDVLHGGTGDDILVGQDGDDTLADQWGGDNILRGGEGSDSFFPGAFGGVEHDTVLGGAGRDLLDLFLVGMTDGATVGAVIDLRERGVQDAGSLGTILLRSVEDLYGTNLADQLTGTRESNLLDGEDGNDTIRGLGGADWITGYGYIWRETPQMDLLEGGGGDDIIVGTNTQGHLQALSTLLGGGGDDQLSEGILLKGGRGSDDLRSWQRDASLLGGAGDDTIQGDAAGQTLVGGAGADMIWAGSELVTLLFRAGDSAPGHSDTVTAFYADDTIDLHIFSKAAGRHLHQVDSFTGHAGQMILLSGVGGSTLEVDVNGDGLSDFHLDISARVNADQLVV